MNKAVLDWVWRGGASYSSNYQAILTYASAQGYSAPSAATKTKQDTLMQAMVSSGVFAKADYILVTTGDGDANFKSIDWKTATKLATVNGTVTWTDALGVKSNGTTGYIDLGYISTSGGLATQNNIAFYTHIASKTGTVNKTAFGQQTSAGSYNIFRPYKASDILTASVTTSISADLANTGNTGRFLQNRKVSGNYTVYKDGSLLHTVSTSSNTPTTAGNMTLLSLNNSLTSTPTISSYFDDNVAVYISGQALDAELAAFDAAYATYFASL